MSFMERPPGLQLNINVVLSRLGRDAGAGRSRLVICWQGHSRLADRPWDYVYMLFAATGRPVGACKADGTRVAREKKQHAEPLAMDYVCMQVRCRAHRSRQHPRSTLSAALRSMVELTRAPMDYVYMHAVRPPRVYGLRLHVDSGTLTLHSRAHRRTWKQSCRALRKPLTQPSSPRGPQHRLMASTLTC